MSIGIPQELNLDKLDIFYEDKDHEFFIVSGLDYPVSYGKHFFTIAYEDLPNKVSQLKADTNVSYKCIKSEAEVEIYMGEKSIKKLILK